MVINNGKPYKNLCGSPVWPGIFSLIKGLVNVITLKDLMQAYEKHKKTNDAKTLEIIIFHYLQKTKPNIYGKTECQDIVKDYITKFNLEIPGFDINRLEIPCKILRKILILSALSKIKSFANKNLNKYYLVKD